MSVLKRLLSVVLFALAVPGGAHAAYPERSITVVTPVAAGDATDIAARVMADELGKLLKVSVLVVNMPGAGGMVGAQNVARAAKDGYTLLFTINATLTSNRILNPQTASYDPLTDFTPLGLTTRTPMVIAVRGDAPYKTLDELAAYARKNPGRVNLGTAGAGSIGDFTVQIASAQTGSQMAMVPFKGAAPSVTAVRGGPHRRCGSGPGTAFSAAEERVLARPGQFKQVARVSEYPDDDRTGVFTEPAGRVAGFLRTGRTRPR